MANYKVILTVKDRYGNSKELDAGTLSVDFSDLTKEDVNQIEEMLPLEDYLKKSEIDIALDQYATEREVDIAIQNAETLRYVDFAIVDDFEMEEGD